MSQALQSSEPVGALAIDTPSEVSTEDPRDRFVGKWVLAKPNTKNHKNTTRKAPWYILDNVTTIDYNADGDLILHATAQIGIRGLNKWVDAGFAKVNTEGIYRCVHTPKNGHNQFRVVHQEGDLVVGECTAFLNGKEDKAIRLIRESTSTKF